MTLQGEAPMEKRVSTGALDVFYLEAGEGPALVLLHGGTMTSGSWSQQMTTFARHFHVLAPDSRGHGRTNNPDGSLSYPAMADDVAAFITAAKLEKPLVVGYSDGGQIALELGIRYPRMPGALVLGGASCAFGPRYFEELRNLGFEGPGEVDVSKMRFPGFDWTESLRREHVRAGQPDYWLSLLDQISHLWYSARDYSSDELATIEAPTLAVVGDRDAMSPVEGVVSMYRRIPGSELMVVPVLITSRPEPSSPITSSWTSSCAMRPRVR
jgi:pimeloyl-ACP methyl ester carboxylesterase